MGGGNRPTPPPRKDLLTSPPQSNRPTPPPRDPASFRRGAALSQRPSGLPATQSGGASAVAVDVSRPPAKELPTLVFREFLVGVSKHAHIGKAKILKEFNQAAVMPGGKLAGSPATSMAVAAGAQKTYSERLEGGVCGAICLQWMARSSDNKEFWKYITTEQGVNNTWAMQAKSRELKIAHDKIQAERAEATREATAFGKYTAKARTLPAGQFRNDIVAAASGLREDILARTHARLAELNATEGELIWAEANRAAQYLKEHSKLERDKDRMDLDSPKDVCKRLMGFEGYAYIGAKGSEGAHGVSVYFSSDHVRVMDPNRGELWANDPRVGAIGLQAHLESLFNPDFLGNCERMELELYPYRQRPGKVELEGAAGKETNNLDTADTVELSYEPPAIQNDNNDPPQNANSVINNNNE